MVTLQVHAGSPEAGMRADAAVNCANTLSALAQLLAGQAGQAEAAGRALAEAESCYEGALQQENDALVGALAGLRYAGRAQCGLAGWPCTLLNRTSRNVGSKTGCTWHHPVFLSLRLPTPLQTWSNLADVLVQHAELCCEQGADGGGAGAHVLYSRAREAYSRACELSSSEDGDDLPGLLLNWGVALLSMAKHAQVSAMTLS